MEPSWASWLPLLRHSVPEILIPEPAWERLEQVARLWPSDCLAAVEARLRKGSHPVDLSIRCTQPHHLRAALDLPFGPVRELLRRWAEGGSLAVPPGALWLAFDLEHASTVGLTEPSIYARVGGIRDSARLIDGLLPGLRGVATTAGERSELRRCLAGIPPEIDLLYVSSMRSRGGTPVRFELGASGAEPLLSCLGDLMPSGGAAEGSLERLRQAASLFAGVDRCLAAVDLLPEFSPRLSLAGRFRKVPRREPGWTRLFERLTAADLCDPAKADAALTVSGWDSARRVPSLWPRTATEEALPGCFARALSHVKVVAEAGKELEAKVYLNAQYLPARPTPGRE